MEPSPLQPKVDAGRAQASMACGRSVSGPGNENGRLDPQAEGRLWPIFQRARQQVDILYKTGQKIQHTDKDEAMRVMNDVRGLCSPER